MTSAVPPHEFEIISRYFSRASRRSDVVLGIGDDAALLQVPADRRLVAAMDTVVEGIHFPAGTAARCIGHRALAVNLSDLAAMGAEPAWALLSLSLPESNADWLQEFSGGFHDLAQRYNVALVGGDTVKGPLVITVQVLGFIEADHALTRSGARPQDLVYVSGIPGEAAAGLAVIQRHLGNSDAGEQLRRRFNLPEPRVTLGRTLRTIASAAMDVSDGLLGDLGKLCEASGCAAELELDRLPPSSSMLALFDAATSERFALSGGDDYELLFTVSPERVAEFEARCRNVEPACTRIGRMTQRDPGQPAVQCRRDGRAVPVSLTGYDHFAGA
ncbi:MAG: thiamine-phosphate kinase [Steroidobacteraceae bacterium]